MGDGGYQQVGGSTDQVKDASAFLDPSGNYASAMSKFQSAFTDASGNFDPNAAMKAFLGQSEGLANSVTGATGPLSQMLNAQAERSAKMGGESALAAMGGPNSGAGMYAFGDAYSKAFADAATQTQQAQLNLYGTLAGQSLSGQYDLMKQGMAGYGGLAEKTGEFYTPTYEKKKSVWDYIMEGAGLGLKGYSTFK